MSSKERILKNIRKALIQKTNQPFPQVDLNKAVYPQPTEPLDILFAEMFTAVQGKFVFCENEQVFMQNLVALAEEQEWEHLFCWDADLQEIFVRYDFRKCRIGKQLDMAHGGITRCEALVARTGSVLLSSGLASGRALPIFPPVHIVVAYISDLVYDIEDALQLMRERYNGKLPSMISLATGPSRTADIEKTLVLGAHGPKDVFVFLIDETKQ